MSEVKTLYKKIKLLEDELSALKAAHATLIQTKLWDNEYHAERIKIAQETNKNQATKIDELKEENTRPASDPKKMIAEGLEYHNMNNKKAPTPMWEPVLIGNIAREIDDKCQELSIHAVLDALLEVCKSNEQEG